MIAMIQVLPVGNALRIFVEPVQGAVFWRILRKTSDSFSGHDDASALVVYEGDEKIFVDSKNLINEVPAFYRPYYNDGTNWVSGVTQSATPVATYEEFTTDVMDLLRQRIETGLKVEIGRGNFQPEHGYIQVFTAPPSLDQNTRFPLVTMILESENPEVRGLGENISGDEFDSIGFDWIESEGWIARVQLAIAAWSLNSDERIELRKALRRIIIANFTVLDAEGISNISAEFHDVNMVNGEFNAPIYQVLCNFSCLAPVRVGNKLDTVSSVEVTVNSIDIGV